MSKTIPDNEIESRLAPDVRKNPSSRARLPTVLETLRIFSDKQNGLTASELCILDGCDIITEMARIPVRIILIGAF